MSATKRFEGLASEIWEGDALEVAKRLPDGSCSLAILDGPYAMNIGPAWDQMKVTDLPTWYAPHLAEVDRVCAASASLYIWNTAEGWATLHPYILADGWVFRSLIHWVKPDGTKKAAVPGGARLWVDTTEVCGFYQREAWAPNTCEGQEIGYAAGRDDRNWVRPWLKQEWTEAGLTMREADTALGTNGMAGHYFNPSQWSLPTWEAFQKLAFYAKQHGRLRARPYFVLEDMVDLRASYDHLRAEYDHLRAEYEQSRPYFSCPWGVGNVWTAKSVRGADRLRDADGVKIHACQKPVLFARRMLESSMRPGETAWVPFGGTCREALAAELIAKANPDEARRVIVAELNADGPDYIGAAVRQIRGQGNKPATDGQVGLFAG